MKLNEEQQKYLLKLARKTLNHYFQYAKKIEIPESNIDEQLKVKAATFVTLTENGDLRGCIGNILPKSPLYKDVINNTLMAAFGDPRFPPLTAKELDQVRIEISVLSKPKRLFYEDIDDLLNKIQPNVHGLIIQSDFNQATFLPQVWEQLPNKEDFLTNLALKAGLSPNAWRSPQTEIFYYTTESFAESEQDTITA